MGAPKRSAYLSHRLGVSRAEFFLRDLRLHVNDFAAINGW